MKKQFILDLAVGIAAYIEIFVLILHTSKKHYPSLILLLPLLTSMFVVIYSYHFANMANKWHKKEEKELLMMR